MNSKTKGILAILLTICLVIGIVPAIVLAGWVVNPNFEETVVNSGVITGDTMLKPGEVKFGKKVTAVNGNPGQFDITLQVAARQFTDWVQDSEPVVYDIVFVLDNSGSMGASIVGMEAAAQQTINHILAQNTLEYYNRVSVVRYAGENKGPHLPNAAPWFSDPGAITFNIGTGTSDGGTNTMMALYEAYRRLSITDRNRAVGNDAKPLIVLLSDGVPTYSYTTVDSGTLVPSVLIGNGSVYGDDWSENDFDNNKHVRKHTANTIQYLQSIKSKVSGNPALTGLEIYTIGFGFNDLSTFEKPYGMATLNPTYANITAANGVPELISGFKLSTHVNPVDKYLTSGTSAADVIDKFSEITESIRLNDPITGDMAVFDKIDSNYTLIDSSGVPASVVFNPDGTVKWTLTNFLRVPSGSNSGAVAVGSNLNEVTFRVELNIASISNPNETTRYYTNTGNYNKTNTDNPNYAVFRPLSTNPFYAGTSVGSGQTNLKDGTVRQNLLSTGISKIKFVPDVGILTITKNDAYTAASGAAYEAIPAGAAFPVTVTFDKYNGIKLPTGFSGSNGTYKGNIALGVPISFLDVPAGAAYTVTETQTGSYAVPTYENQTGVITNGCTSYVTISNLKIKAPGVDVAKSIVGGTKAFYVKGDTIPFQIVVSNTGGVALTIDSIIDKINNTGDALEVYWNTAGNGRTVFEAGVSTITLAPGGSHTFFVDYTVTGNETGTNGANKNFVTVSGKYADDTPFEKSSHAKFCIAQPDLSVVKEQIGTTSSYENDGKWRADYRIVVKNNSNKVPLYNVILDDDMLKSGTKSGFELLAGSLKDENNNSVSFPHTIGSLAPGAEKTFTYSMILNANIWDIEDLLVTQDGTVAAWLAAQTAYEAALVAYEAALASYNTALATAETNEGAALAAAQTAYDDAVATALENYDTVRRDYEALSIANDMAMYAFNQAMAQYQIDLAAYNASDDPSAVEPTMPELLLTENSEQIGNFKAKADALYDDYLAAIANTAELNAALSAYNTAIAAAKPLDFDAVEENFIAAKAAFEALGELNVDFKLPAILPGDDVYENTVSATYKLQNNVNAPTDTVTGEKVIVTVEPETSPALAIDKKASLTGTGDWDYQVNIGHPVSGETFKTVYFRMTIKNVGTEKIEGISIYDDFDGTKVTGHLQLNGFSGTLDIGESAVITWSEDVPFDTSYQTDIKVNTFTVRYGGGTPAPYDKSVSAYIVIPAKQYAKVTLDKKVRINADIWGDKASVTSNDDVTFTFKYTLTNIGTKDTTVEINDVYNLMTYDTTHAGYVGDGRNTAVTLYDDDTFSRDVTTVIIPAGETKVLFAKITVASGMYIRNAAVAEYTGGKPGDETVEDHADANVNPLPKAYFDIVKQSVIQLGDENTTELLVNDGDIHTIFSDAPITLTFKITVTNKGSAPGSVILTDTLEGGILTDKDGTVIDTANVEVELNPGESKSFYYTVNNANPDTTVNNIAILSLPSDSDDVLIKEEDDATTKVVSLDTIPLVIEKLVKNAEGNWVDAATFTIGNGDVKDVEFKIIVKLTATISSLSDTVITGNVLDIFNNDTFNGKSFAYTLNADNGFIEEILYTVNGLGAGNYTNVAMIESTDVDGLEEGYKIVATVDKDTANVTLSTPPTVIIEDYYPPYTTTPTNPTVPNEDTPLTDIPNEDAPLTNLPDEEAPLADIPNEDAPLADTPNEEPPLTELPKTGVSVAFIPFAAIGFVILCVGVILKVRKRETSDDNKSN